MYLAAMAPARVALWLALLTILLVLWSDRAGARTHVPLGQGTGLPSIAAVHGPLSIKVIYPAPDDLIEVEDSSFLLGSVGDGDATLTIDGRPIPVAPNGAFLAWVPYPAASPA